MPFEELKARVCRANLDLVKAGLVVLTWGNASEADRVAGVMAIKPSGVDYSELTPDDIVLVNLHDGELAEKCRYRPSSDTPTHLKLYHEISAMGGIAHTHSVCATSWAQSGREIPCLGTTHADHFYGAIPVTREMTREEIEEAYELHTATAIVDRLAGMDASYIPGILVRGHGPFAWGPNVAKAVENAIVLETTALMALQTYALNPGAAPLPQALLDKHFLRKHGKNAYYGQY